VERLALVPGGNHVWLPDAHRWVHPGDGRITMLAHARECAVAGDGKRAACVFRGDGEPYIQLVAVPGGERIGSPVPLPGRRARDTVSAASGHSDGRIALGVTADGATSVWIWDSPVDGRGAESHALVIPGAPKLRFAGNDPDSLWALADDGRLQQWQISTGKLVAERDGARLLDVAASPSDVRLAVSAPGGIVVQRVPGPSQVLASSSGVTLARFASPSSVIGVVRNGDQDVVAIWREAEYEALDPGSSNQVTALTAIDPASAIGAHVLAATGRADGTVELWTRSGSPKAYAARGHGSAIRHIVAGPAWLATSADDGTVSVWRIDARPERDRTDESEHGRLVELVRLNGDRGPGAPMIAFSPSTTEPAIAIGQRSGDVEVVTLGKPMPGNAKDVVAGAITTR
jgi:WD40 repeat protein